MSDVKPLTDEEEYEWRKSVAGPGSAHLNNVVMRRTFATLDAERAKVARLREALEFYANVDNYDGGTDYSILSEDYGTRARAALKDTA